MREMRRVSEAVASSRSQCISHFAQYVPWILMLTGIIALCWVFITDNSERVWIYLFWMESTAVLCVKSIENGWFPGKRFRVQIGFAQENRF